jgi:hypothetical protein
MVIGTDFGGRYKSNYHMLMAITWFFFAFGGIYNHYNVLFCFLGPKSATMDCLGNCKARVF